METTNLQITFIPNSQDSTEIRAILLCCSLFHSVQITNYYLITHKELICSLVANHQRPVSLNLSLGQAGKELEAGSVLWPFLFSPMGQLMKSHRRSY